MFIHQISPSQQVTFFFQSESLSSISLCLSCSTALSPIHEMACLHCHHHLTSFHIYTGFLWFSSVYFRITQSILSQKAESHFLKQKSKLPPFHLCFQCFANLSTSSPRLRDLRLYPVLFTILITFTLHNPTSLQSGWSPFSSANTYFLPFAHHIFVILPSQSNSVGWDPSTLHSHVTSARTFTRTESKTTSITFIFHHSL